MMSPWQLRLLLLVKRRQEVTVRVQRLQAPRTAACPTRTQMIRRLQVLRLRLDQTNTECHRRRRSTVLQSGRQRSHCRQMTEAASEPPPQYAHNPQPLRLPALRLPHPSTARRLRRCATERYDECPLAQRQVRVQCRQLTRTPVAVAGSPLGAAPAARASGRPRAPPPEVFGKHRLLRLIRPQYGCISLPCDP